MEQALETRDLTKVYGEGETAVRALDGVSVEVESDRRRKTAEARYR